VGRASCVGGHECPVALVGFYSRPSFDTEFNENGTDVLVSVELKRPGVRLSSDEKGQVWKYVKELIQKGHVTDRTTVYSQSARCAPDDGYDRSI
jgi:hypothetical protein